MYKFPYKLQSFMNILMNKCINNWSKWLLKFDIWHFWLNHISIFWNILNFFYQRLYFSWLIRCWWHDLLRNITQKMITNKLSSFRNWIYSNLEFPKNMSVISCHAPCEHHISLYAFQKSYKSGTLIWIQQQSYFYSYIKPNSHWTFFWKFPDHIWIESLLKCYQN